MTISTAILQAFAAWSASEAAEDDATVEAEADRFGELYEAVREAEPASIEEVFNKAGFFAWYAGACGGIPAYSYGSPEIEADLARVQASRPERTEP